MRIEERITEYLSGGGLFNPELANHDAVRDLLIASRQRVAELEAQFAGLQDDMCNKVMAMTDDQINAALRLEGRDPKDADTISKQALKLATLTVERDAATARAEAAEKELKWQREVGGYRVYPDGNQWCAVKSDFINLQESDAAFGNSPFDAITKLLEIPAINMRKLFAVRAPSGYVAGIGFSEKEAWRNAGFNSLQVEHGTEYKCVPATLSAAGEEGE